MNDRIWISLYSAASWADEAIWTRFLETTRDATGLLPRRMGQFEPLRTVFPSVDEAARMMASLPERGVRHWILRYGNGIYGMIAYYPTPEEHKGFLYNNVFITIPVSRFKSAMGGVDIRNWFCGLAEPFHAFYGDVELESTINQESQILQRRWNLKYEFPTFGWLTYFSNGVVSFFGKEKVPSLSPYAEQSKDGILLAMGDTPEEAATRREEKFRLERILGADSFTVPVVLSKIDESTVDTERLYETDPFYHLPKMPNGELKPEFTYVPSFQVLSKEFARPDSPESHAEDAEDAE